MSSEWAIGEVFGFDEELLAFIPQPIVGVIVAVEGLKNEEDEDEDQDKAKGSADNTAIVPFYMKQTQVLDNACGIIACLHAVLNNGVIDLAPGGVLDSFKQETKEKSPEERALSLESNRGFKAQHGNFAA